LLQGLQAQGVTPVVYCPQLEVPSTHDPLVSAGCQVQRFNAFVPILGLSAERKRELISVGGNLMSFDLISSLWRDGEASVIHSHTLGRIGGIALTVAKKKKVPFVVTIHGGALDLPSEVKKDFNAPLKGWEWGKLFGLLFQSRRLFQDADAVITCNGNEAALLREKYPEKRILVQPHGVPLECYQEDQRAASLAAFPQLQGKQILLNVGRIDPIKNQLWLVEQAPTIFQKHPRAVLVLAGACTHEAYGHQIRKRVEELGLVERVLFTGGLPPNDPRLIGLFQQADVLVLTSVSETFGLVILEAWATGTMVLSSRTSGAASLVRDGHNGWLFDLPQPETFHRALDQALAKSEPAKRLLRQGADEVNRKYNVAVLADRMKTLYEQLIEEKQCAM
jgi:glycosyltransferase involved in cell wall biosynthesis